MVRILRVTELQERRRALVAQSDIHRRAMMLELANARYSVGLWKRRWTRLRNLGVWAAAAASAATLFSTSSKERTTSANGLLGRLLQGFRMGIGLMAIIRKFKSAESGEPEAEETAEFR